MSTPLSEPNKSLNSHLETIKTALLTLFFFTIFAAVIYPWIKPEIVPLGPLNDRTQGPASSPTPPGTD
jgi:hypothetical protein